MRRLRGLREPFNLFIHTLNHAPFASLIIPSDISIRTRNHAQLTSLPLLHPWQLFSARAYREYSDRLAPREQRLPWTR